MEIHRQPCRLWAQFGNRDRKLVNSGPGRTEEEDRERACGNA
jgi:hypothetical protein